MFTPTRIKGGLIYYTGAAIDGRAYASLAFEIAARGYLVVIVQQPNRIGSNTYADANVVLNSKDPIFSGKLFVTMVTSLRQLIIETCSWKGYLHTTKIFCIYTQSAVAVERWIDLTYRPSYWYNPWNGRCRILWMLVQTFSIKSE